MWNRFVLLGLKLERKPQLRLLADPLFIQLQRGVEVTGAGGAFR